jgi:hypothetical protein
VLIGKTNEVERLIMTEMCPKEFISYPDRSSLLFIFVTYKVMLGTMQSAYPQLAWGKIPKKLSESRMISAVGASSLHLPNQKY